MMSQLKAHTPHGISKITVLRVNSTADIVIDYLHNKLYKKHITLLDILERDENDVLSFITNFTNVIATPLFDITEISPSGNERNIALCSSCLGRLIVNNKNYQYTTPDKKVKKESEAEYCEHCETPNRRFYLNIIKSIYT